MNPVLSWAVLLISAGAAYVYIYGLPKQVISHAQDAKRKASETTSQTAKKTNRKLRAAVKPKLEALNQAATEIAPALANGTTGNAKTTQRKEHKQSKVQVNGPEKRTKEPEAKSAVAKEGGFVPAPWYNRDAAQSTIEDSDDPVKNVMMG